MVNSTTPHTAAPFTLACWAQTDDLTTVRTFISLADSAGTAESFNLIHATTAIIRCNARSASVNNQADTTTTLATGTWGYATAVFRSSTSRDVYLNGGGKGSNTNSAAPSSIDRIKIGVRASSNYVLQHDGKLAEAITVRDLSDDQVLLLANGLHPFALPYTLTGYWPLFGTNTVEPDWSPGKRTMTLTGTTIFDHPPRISVPFGGARPFEVPTGVQVITASGLATAEAFGAAKLNRLLAGLTGIAGAEAFGSASLVMRLAPTGIGSAEAHGSAQLNRTLPSGTVASLEAHGATRLRLNIAPSGIGSLETFGIAALRLILRATGIASAEAFGSARMRLAISASGIASGQAIGTASILGGIITLQPSGITSAEAFGSALIAQAITLLPSGIASAEAFGTAKLNRVLAGLSGIASAEGVGTARILLYLLAQAIASAEAHGTPLLQPGVVTISPTGVATGQALGTPTMIAAQTVAPTAIPSGETFGTTVIAMVILLAALGLLGETRLQAALKGETDLLLSLLGEATGRTIKGQL